VAHRAQHRQWMTRAGGLELKAISKAATILVPKNSTVNQLAACPGIGWLG
jgi:hypothetical protein